MLRSGCTQPYSQLKAPTQLPIAQQHHCWNGIAWLHCKICVLDFVQTIPIVRKKNVGVCVSRYITDNDNEEQSAYTNKAEIIKLCHFA